MYHDIMVPLDGSTFAEQALPHALFFARAAKARLHLVVVHEPMPSWVPSSAGGGPATSEAKPVELAYLDGLCRGKAREECALDARLPERVAGDHERRRAGQDEPPLGV